jgi:hypothetical protein
MSTYTAHIDYVDHPAEINCVCEDCSHEETADKLDEIGDCSLTPGDPSPAGRCTLCGTLSYVIKEAR